MSRTEQGRPTRATVEATVLSMLEERGSVSARKVVGGTDKSKATVIKHINEMVADGTLETTEPAGSTKQRYRLASK